MSAAHFAKPSSSSAPNTTPADHHTLGKKLNLFSSSIYSAGSPLLHPDGSHLFLKLQSLLRALHADFGFLEVVSPIIYKKALWERSGHWENYSNDMFEVIGRDISNGDAKVGKEVNEDETWCLKPMNCPGHCLLFATETRSYRDLPVRYADFSPLHRNEVSGSLSGLTRTRCFHQDDGHIHCRPDQVRDEISKTLEMIDLVYSAFGLRGAYSLVLSTRPSSDFIGTVEEWDQAENQLKESLHATHKNWSLNAGDGAFYGPKIDILLRDMQGKEHQTATVQLDFQLPKRFGLQYQVPLSDSASTSTPEAPLDQATPILIHRAVFGSLERFLALLIERYAGHFPLWLSPHQVKIITTNTSEPAVTHAQAIATLLNSNHGKRRLPDLTSQSMKYLVDLDTEPITLKRKFANAQKEKWCITCTVGRQEVEDGTVKVNFMGMGRGPAGDVEQRFDRARKIVHEELVGAKEMASLTMVPEKLKRILDRFCGEYL